MIEALLGTIFGGAFRLAPEVLKWFDRANERKHERAMLTLNIQADRLRAEHSEKLATIEADKAIGVAEIQALIEGAKAQAVQTGIKWVDAMSSLMRPMLTFWWAILMYSAALVSQFIVLLNTGSDGVDAILKLWGSDEKAIVASIMSFWFLDRALRKR